MRVILAGYNLDTTVIDGLKKAAKAEREDVTPETLSAAYARISRDPRPVDELRSIARKEVEKARKSNKKIIFGMGHHSVAEHAAFNFDIIGVSRLCIEEIEKFRLNSFTEKSQRYITLGNDYLIPAEIKNSPFMYNFVNIIEAQNQLYHHLYDLLKEHIFKKYSDLAKDEKNHKTLDGWAKEDARYITSLATEGQLGLTLNARNLELMVRRFASHSFEEVRILGGELFKGAHKIAPSIILFTEANDFDQKTYPELKEHFQGTGKREASAEGVSLVDHTSDADDKLIASLMHTSTNLSYEECLKKATEMTLEEKKEIIKIACQHMELYDATLREFEYVDLTFNLIISASCFAQLKRHRMATITCQKYDPGLGITIPDSIKEIRMESTFMEMINKTNDIYYQIEKKLGPIAQYVLTNAHRKRVLLRVDARELYHISRLREDIVAQWDIRERSHEMSVLAKEVMPLTMMLLGGKDSYPKVYESVYGHPPKVIEPKLPT